MRFRDVAAATGLQSEQRPYFRWRINNVVKDHRRGDGAMGRIVVGIKTVGAPQFLPGSRIVSCYAVASSDHNLGGFALTEQPGRGIRIRGFTHSIGWSLDLPKRLAGFRIYAQQ